MDLMDLIQIIQGPAAGALLAVGGLTLLALLGLGDYLSRKRKREENDEAELRDVQQPDDSSARD